MTPPSGALSPLPALLELARVAELESKLPDTDLEDLLQISLPPDLEGIVRIFGQVTGRVLHVEKKRRDQIAQLDLPFVMQTHAGDFWCVSRGAATGQRGVHTRDGVGEMSVDELGDFCGGDRKSTRLNSSLHSFPTRRSSDLYISSIWQEHFLWVNMYMSAPPVHASYAMKIGRAHV